MPKLDLLSAAVWKIYGRGGPNAPPPPRLGLFVTVNGLIVRGLKVCFWRQLEVIQLHVACRVNPQRQR